MPVSTDHLADEIKELRESQQQMTEVIRDLVRDFGNFRVDVVDRLEASQRRTDAALSGLRSEMVEKFAAFDAKSEASQKRTDAALSGLRSEMVEKFAAFDAKSEASRERTEKSLTEIRVEVAEKFGAINNNLESFRGRVELALTIASWTVGILIPLFFSLIGFGFWFTWHAAKLDSAVETLKSRAPLAVLAPKGR